jgi:ABC-type polar amino acid transport system ATPase subunit
MTFSAEKAGSPLRMAFARDIADHVVVMDAGQVVE